MAIVLKNGEIVSPPPTGETTVSVSAAGGLQTTGPDGVTTSTAFSGNAADLTGTLAPARIADGSLALAKQANLVAAAVVGRALGAATGVPVALTAAQLGAIAGSRMTRHTIVADGNTFAFGGTLDGDNDGDYFINFNLWFIGDPGEVKLQFNGADTGMACRWITVDAATDDVTGGHSNTKATLATASSNGNVLSGHIYMPSRQSYRIGNAEFSNTFSGESRTEKIFFTTAANITSARFVCVNNNIDHLISFVDFIKLGQKGT